MGNSLTSRTFYKISSISDKPQTWFDDYLGQYHYPKKIFVAIATTVDFQPHLCKGSIEFHDQAAPNTQHEVLRG